MSDDLAQKSEKRKKGDSALCFERQVRRRPSIGFARSFYLTTTNFFVTLASGLLAVAKYTPAGTGIPLLFPFQITS